MDIIHVLTHRTASDTGGSKGRARKSLPPVLQKLHGSVAVAGHLAGFKDLHDKSVAPTEYKYHSRNRCPQAHALLGKERERKRERVETFWNCIIVGVTEFFSK